MDRFLGLFLNPVFAQYEGVSQVLDNIQQAGVLGISTGTSVGRPAENGRGKRFPDLHMDGYERLLGRALWGKFEQQLEFYSCLSFNNNLYDLFPTVSTNYPDDIDYDLPFKLVNEANRRNLQTHIQFQPLIPPFITEEHKPRYIDGTVPQSPQITMYACPNHPMIQAFGLARLTDIVQNFADIDGIFIDWTEYGAYRLEDLFVCTCEHCQAQALEWGFDWDEILRDVGALWKLLHNLTPRQLDTARRFANNPWFLLELLMQYPGWLAFLKFKAQTITHYYQLIRSKLDQLGHANTKLSARGWPPPWNRISGLSYRDVASIVDVVTPKLFLFDYSALPRWYGQTLLNWNPSLSEEAILDTIIALMQLEDSIQNRSFAHYHIPPPEEHHPAFLTTYRKRLDEVCSQISTETKVYPFAHAYLPEQQWKRMIALVRDSRVDGMWVQMYGYLSDRKLEILKNLWR